MELAAAAGRAGMAFRAAVADRAYGHLDNFRAELRQCQSTRQAGLAWVMAVRPRHGTWAYGAEGAHPQECRPCAGLERTGRARRLARGRARLPRRAHRNVVGRRGPTRRVGPGRGDPAGGDHRRLGHAAGQGRLVPGHHCPAPAHRARPTARTRPPTWQLVRLYGIRHWIEQGYKQSPRPKLTPLDLTAGEQAELERWVRRRKGAPDMALRARLILACEAVGKDGLPVSTKVVAERVGVSRETVSKWRRCFLANRLAGLSDDPRLGRPRTVSDEQVAELIAQTLETKPANATHWSTRSMAEQVGLSQSTVSRIWRAFGLQPHCWETFKLSADPFFVEKVHDVVGLYLNPQERALVLCVDEKSQIQALDRSQPVLPMMPGVPERATHDYVRAATTTLFAALNVASGKVLGSLHRKHRAVEFKKFLIRLDKEVPDGLDVHLICDNYVTHKTPTINKWLLAHPRFYLHFTPTGSS